MSTVLGASIFGYVFPDNREGMEDVLTRLTEDHFTDETQSTFFKILSRYGEKHAEVFPGVFLVDLLKRNGISESKSVLLNETYESYCQAKVSQDAFNYAIEGMIDDLNKIKSGTIIATGFEIQENGKEIDGTYLKGYRDADAYILSHLSDLDQEVSDTSPEGDIRLEAEEILADYEHNANSDTKSGIGFGIGLLDDLTSGMQAGEFAIIAAFTNQGKSQFSVQTAWNASVVEGKPTYFATTETVRNTTRRRVLARHSKLPQFGYERGLDVQSIKNGTLTKDEEAVWHDVVKDFTTNSNYAPLYIAQMPRNVTINYLESSLNRVNRSGPDYELLVADYLQLWNSLRKRTSEREEMNEILKEAKKFCTSFDKGRGIAFLTPWQMSREAFDKAKRDMSYSLASLSDTSEAEKTPDLIIALLRPDLNANEGLIQILKGRDGPLMEATNVYLDYRCSYIGDNAGAAPAGVQDLAGGLDINSLLLGNS